jgi:hypothetical protein
MYFWSKHPNGVALAVSFDGRSRLWLRAGWAAPKQACKRWYRPRLRCHEQGFYAAAVVVASGAN